MLVLRYTANNSHFDGTTDVSDGAPYVRNAVDGSFTCALPDGTFIGRVDPVQALRAAEADLGVIIPKSDKLQRLFGVGVDDFALSMAVLATSPNNVPIVGLQDRTIPVEPLTVETSLDPTDNVFVVREEAQDQSPVAIYTGQALTFNDQENPEDDPRSIQLTLFLEPLDNPRDFVRIARRAQLSNRVRLLRENMLPVPVANTAAPVPVMNFSIPADAAGRNGYLKGHVSGDYLNNEGNPHTFEVSILYGGLVLWRDTFTVATNAAQRAFSLDFEIVNQDDPTDQTGKGLCFLSPPSAAVAGLSDVNTAPLGGPLLLAAGTVVTTEANLLTVEVQHDAADPAIVFNKQAAWVEVAHRGFN